MTQPLGHRPEAVVELGPHHPLDAGHPGAERLLQQLDPALQLAVGAELAGQVTEAIVHQPFERLQLALDLGEGLPLGPLLGQLGDHRPAEELVDPRHLRHVGVLTGAHRRKCKRPSRLTRKAGKSRPASEDALTSCGDSFFNRAFCSGVAGASSRV